MEDKKLQLDSKNKMIGGVGSGIAKYFEIDATVVRLGLVLALILLWYWGGNILSSRIFTNERKYKE